jgi:hypothetical protein
MVLRMGQPCKAVHAYQVAAFATGSRSIRIKCSLEPVYQIRIDAQGTASLQGSGGRIKALEAYPEAIIEVSGVSAERFLRQEALMPKPPVVKPQQQSLSADTFSLFNNIEKRTHTTPLFFWMACAGLIALLTIACYTFIAYRRYNRNKTRPASSHFNTRNLRDKDALIEESWEIYPRIFKHPHGFFLARGRTGKRRLFHNSFGALLYRDFGIRFGEIKS